MLMCNVSIPSSFPSSSLTLFSSLHFLSVSLSNCCSLLPISMAAVHLVSWFWYSRKRGGIGDGFYDLLSECFIIILSWYLIASNGTYCFSAFSTTLRITLGKKCSSVVEWIKKSVTRKSNQCISLQSNDTNYSVHFLSIQKSKEFNKNHINMEVGIEIYCSHSIFHPPKQKIYPIYHKRGHTEQFRV